MTVPISHAMHILLCFRRINWTVSGQRYMGQVGLWVKAFDPDLIPGRISDAKLSLACRRVRLSTPATTCGEYEERSMTPSPASNLRQTASTEDLTADTRYIPWQHQLSTSLFTCLQQPQLSEPWFNSRW